MTYGDFKVAMATLSAAYNAEQRQGPSMKWLRKYARSRRCTPLEQQACKDLLDASCQSWFLVPRSCGHANALSCSYSVFRQISDWHASSPWDLGPCNLNADGLLIVRMDVPRGRYTLNVGYHEGTIYYYGLWSDEDKWEWGMFSASSVTMASEWPIDTRISIRSLLESGGVMGNSLLVAAYSSHKKLYDPERPESVEVTFDARSIA